MVHRGDGCKQGSLGKAPRGKAALRSDCGGGGIGGDVQGLRWPSPDSCPCFPQPVTATCMLVGAASTWSFTSCRGARAGASALTVATTRPAATATTARRAITATWASPSPTARPAKVGGRGPGATSIFLYVSIYLYLSVYLSICLPLSLFYSYPHAEIIACMHAFWRCKSEQRGGGDAIPGEERGVVIPARVQGSQAPPPSVHTGVLHTAGRGSCSPGLLSAQRTLFHQNLADAFLWRCAPIPTSSSPQHSHRCAPSQMSATWGGGSGVRGRGSEAAFNPPANSFTSQDKKLKGDRGLYFLSLKQVVMF